MAARKSTGKAGPARTDSGPVNSKADVAEHVAPARGAGPTRVGSNTPVSSARTVPAAITDRSQAATGTSIFEKADAGNRRLGQRNRS